MSHQIEAGTSGRVTARPRVLSHDARDRVGELRTDSPHRGIAVPGVERLQEPQLSRQREHDEPGERAPARDIVAHHLLDDGPPRRVELRPQQRQIPVQDVKPGAGTRTG